MTGPNTRNPVLGGAFYSEEVNQLRENQYKVESLIKTPMTARLFGSLKRRCSCHVAAVRLAPQRRLASRGHKEEFV